MSGHSKWANIKHKKAKEDASRGKIFTKLIKEITISARESGGDLNGNPRLRTIVEKARHENMPLENIKRAIQKGTGELPGQQYERHTYEGYGPGGIAVIIEVLTDNKNRAIAEVRHIFARKGGNIAENGAVNWMFEHKGSIRFISTKFSEDEMLEKLIDFDIDSITKEEDVFHIICAVKSIDEIKKTIESLSIKVDHAEIEWVAKTPFTPESDEESQQAIDFLEALDELDDIQNVYSNLA